MTIGGTIEDRILQEVGDEACTQADVAVTYRLALHRHPGEIDWAKINRAIANRWSLAGLGAVKKKAWNQ